MSPRSLRVGGWLIFLLLAAGCSTARHRPERPKPPPDNPAVVELKELLADYNQKVADKDFDGAESKLNTLESRIKKADVATITHRDYPDLAAQVRAARSGLAGSKRDAMLGALISATQERLDAADKILDEVAKNGPTDDALDTLEDVLKRLRALVDEGRPQRKVAPYSEFAVDLDRKLAALTVRDRQHRWQLDAAEELTAAVKKVVAPPPELVPDRDLDDQIDRYDDIVAGFHKCGEAAARWAQHKDFVAELKLKTALGTATLEEVENQCAAREELVTGRRDTLKWMTVVQAAVDKVRRAGADLTDARTSTLKLEANERVAPLYADCGELLVRTEEKPGFDPKVLFATPLGRLSAVKLRDACGAEAKRLFAERPNLRWRIAVEQVGAELEEARREAKSGVAESNPADALEPLAAAIKGFAACAEHADVLGALKDARWKEARPDKAELTAIKDVAATCRREHDAAQKLVAAANAALAPKAPEKKADDKSVGKKDSSTKPPAKSPPKTKKH